VQVDFEPTPPCSKVDVDREEHVLSKWEGGLEGGLGLGCTLQKMQLTPVHACVC